MIREELKRLGDWEERHRRLVGRLAVVLIATAVVDAIGTVLVYALERGARGTDIHTLFDAFFFTTVQILTVSSSLKNPVTNAGQVVDVLLELWAVFVITAVAGSFAAFFRSGDAA